MFKLFARTRKPIQLELWPITDGERMCNENVKAIRELWTIMDAWKVRPDHTKQLNLFDVGPAQMWQLMVDREGN